MRTNPFCQTEAPAWLSTGPAHQIPRLLENLLELAEHVPDVYETLPWLKKMDVWYLILERMSDEPQASQEATLTSFFANVTQPVAEMIENLYVSRLLRRVSCVAEILRRMAQHVGVSALPLDVVTGVCYSFWHRRASVLSEDPIRVQETTWYIGWQQLSVQVCTAHGVYMPFLLLISEESTGKILAFRSTQCPPEKADVLLTLADALIFSTPDPWHLYPPAHLHVQRPLLPEIVQAGASWRIEVEEVEPSIFPFVQQWEQELKGRVLNLIQSLRIFDRACERVFGYAPFLTKQQTVRRIGWGGMRLYDEPSWLQPRLREILPAYEAVVGSDGTLIWHGWHYRDMEEDVLRYWPGEAVTIRPTPICEAVIWVYWGHDILCSAFAEELYCQDGYFRPYWFPYPQLGE